jgi:hypothetical protein
MPVAYDQALSILITAILLELNVVHYLVFDRSFQRQCESVGVPTGPSLSAFWFGKGGLGLHGSAMLAHNQYTKRDVEGDDIPEIFTLADAGISRDVPSR